MNDRAVALLEQYEIEVLRTRKGRGAILCDTQQGCLIFKEYTGREEQLRLQEQVLKHNPPLRVSVASSSSVIPYVMKIP